MTVEEARRRLWSALDDIDTSRPRVENRLAEFEQALIADAEQQGREAERETLRPMLQQAEAVIRSLIRDAPLADELHAAWEQERHPSHEVDNA